MILDLILFSKIEWNSHCIARSRDHDEHDFVHCYQKSSCDFNFEKFLNEYPVLSTLNRHV